MWKIVYLRGNKMYTLKGVRCPYCGNEFKEGDDVVVCPQCGTPHHRSCYASAGVCANLSRHDEGFVWESPAAEQAAQSQEQPLCPNCQKPYSPGDRFCNNCGQPLESSNGPAFERSFLPDIDENAEIDGVKVSLLRQYLGSSWQYYVYQFMMQDSFSRKISFNWSALIFPGMFFLYRKLWGMAALSFVVSLVCGLPSATLYLTSFGYQLPFLSYSVWSSASMICGLISMAYCITCSLYASWMIRRSAIKNINRLTDAYGPGEQLSAALRAKGGTSLAAVIIAGAIALIFSAVVALLITR